ncbi:hypothetical protein [Paraliobacillus ryukyuensis]|uniref:hypothetical protein n=1 Tax=Paraliobacillus ryukyuensis TaxID=200904 RepID=UPI0009A627A2|nr:hypothetical protein [Paraliobacillus ryukyuensis]
MTTNSTNINPQNYIISGVKFFKSSLDKLRLDASVTDHPITASEIAVYMILHNHADEAGQIFSFTNDPSISDRKLLCVSNIAKEHDLVYETTKKALDSLIERNYVQEMYSSNGIYYVLTDYAANNNKDNLNYFRIPKTLFEEKIFGKMITHRYHKGPILLLELSQYFTRQIGTNRKHADLDELQGERTMDYLKRTLHTTAKRVRQFLDIIKGVFSFTPMNTYVKEPSAKRMNAIRKFSQICIDKFQFTMNKACFLENDKHQEKKLIAYAKREMANKLKNANIHFRWRDTLDINKSINRIGKIASYLSVVNKNKDMLRRTLLQVGDQLETMQLNNELHTIKSIGAFVNKLFTTAWSDYQKEFITPGDKIDIATAYFNIYGENPGFLD